jgi:hypothetical protein
MRLKPCGRHWRRRWVHVLRPLHRHWHVRRHYLLLLHVWMPYNKRMLLLLLLLLRCSIHHLGTGRGEDPRCRRVHCPRYCLMVWLGVHHSSSSSWGYRL